MQQPELPGIELSQHLHLNGFNEATSFTTYVQKMGKSRPLLLRKTATNTLAKRIRTAGAAPCVRG